MITIILIVVLVPLILMSIISGIRIVGQYERAVLLRLGRFTGILQPGLNVVLPFGIDRTLFVEMRTTTIDVPRQDIITKDNVPVSIDAVVYFQVFDPQLAILNVENYRQATTLYAQTLLRSVLGSHDLDEMLTAREKLNLVLKEQLDKATDPWGIKVTGVEIKAVDLPEGMKRAMAKQAEAERERRAKVISAEGEYQASEKLLEAASVISQNPTGALLRILQTLTEIAVEKNSTILFPLPIEILSFFQGNGSIHDQNKKRDS
ncbi:slipin family protein [Heliobacterium chlorum]|uniref:Slipin family protein n=1 Tax=Heliobacterium chlorum TaxID=2698 RepID=A0ABR7T3P9_HELCL|nr:slipin family protein [Heliobacterium chlorum]MBC9784965.1 slipin family protein [Heliobacterium chlorum]